MIGRFFFRKSKIHVFGICRIVFGASLFLHYMSLFPHWRETFGPDGLWGYRAHEHMPWLIDFSTPGASHFHVLQMVGSAGWIGSLFVLELLSSFLFCIGLFARTSGIVMILLHILFHAQNEYAYWGWAELIIPFTFYTLLSPTMYRWSIDSWLKPKSYEIGRIWPARLLQIHICALYLMVAWTRIKDADWLDGSMLHAVLTQPLFGRLDWDWRLLRQPLQVACHLSWILELGAPIALWIPRIGVAWAFGLIFLHAALELTTMVGWWNAVMMAVLIVFISRPQSSQDLSLGREQN